MAGPSVGVTRILDYLSSSLDPLGGPPCEYALLIIGGRIARKRD
jgi:hypothetical protein